jgi:outer membrane protein assembly factor BamB
MTGVRVGGRVRAYVLFCAVIAATGSMARGDWTQFRYDPAHHGVSPDETILSPETVGDLTVEWRTSIGDGTFASLSVAGGKVYVVSLSPAGKLYALDRVTGQQLWNFPPDAITGDHAWTSPAVANGIVYFGVNRPIPVVFAVNAITGQEIWRHTGPVANIISSPALIDGRVYVAFTDGSIRALDATNGQVIWDVIHAGGAYSSPAVADGRLYIAIHNHGLLALNAATGATLWLAPMPGPQWSSPAVDNGRVFVGSRDDHKLYAFDAVTGATLWTATTSDWVQTSPAVANGVVYIGNNAGNLYAFNAGTGGLIWQRAVSPGFAIFSSPTVANGVVYVASSLDASATHFDGKLYAVDAATSNVLFSAFVGNGEGQALASPTVDGGTVYIPSYDQSAVTAFGLNAPTPTPTPTPTPIATPTPTPTPGGITLTASGRRVHGVHTVDLFWTGATSANVDIYRDGVVRATVPNSGSYTDNTGNKGSNARYTYKVCEAGTQTCSNEVTVKFGGPQL